MAEIMLDLSPTRKKELLDFFRYLKKADNIRFYIQQSIAMAKTALLGQTGLVIPGKLQEYLHKKIIVFLKDELDKTYKNETSKKTFFENQLQMRNSKNANLKVESPDELLAFIKRADSQFWLNLKEFISKVVLNDPDEDLNLQFIKNIIMFNFYNDAGSITRCFNTLKMELLGLIDGEKRKRRFEEKYKTLEQWVSANNTNQLTIEAILMFLTVAVCLSNEYFNNSLRTANLLRILSAIVIFGYLGKKWYDNNRICREWEEEITKICEFDVELASKNTVKVVYPKLKQIALEQRKTARIEAVRYGEIIPSASISAPEEFQPKVKRKNLPHSESVPTPVFFASHEQEKTRKYKYVYQGEEIKEDDPYLIPVQESKGSDSIATYVYFTGDARNTFFKTEIKGETESGEPKEEVKPLLKPWVGPKKGKTCFVKLDQTEVKSEYLLFKYKDLEGGTRSKPKPNDIVKAQAINKEDANLPEVVEAPYIQLLSTVKHK